MLGYIGDVSCVIKYIQKIQELMSSRRLEPIWTTSTTSCPNKLISSVLNNKRSYNPWIVCLHVHKSLYFIIYILFEIKNTFHVIYREQNWQILGRGLVVTRLSIKTITFRHITVGRRLWRATPSYPVRTLARSLLPHLKKHAVWPRPSRPTE